MFFAVGEGVDWVSNDSEASNAAISAADKNRPPGPLGLRMACLCRDS